MNNDRKDNMKEIRQWNTNMQTARKKEEITREIIWSVSELNIDWTMPDRESNDASLKRVFMIKIGLNTWVRIDGSKTKRLHE